MASLSFRENSLLAYQHKVPEYLPLDADCDNCKPRGPDFIWEAYSLPGTGKDWFGQSWTFEPKIGGANPTPGVHLVPDITRWREYLEFPDLSKLNWEKHAAEDTAGWCRERRLSRVGVGYGLWERMFSVMDFRDALCALLEEPDACYDFFEAVAEHKIRLHEYLIRYYKPDVLIMHDDYGSGSGMFMSPDIWRSLIKPHLSRIIRSVTEKGVIYEHHCCGYFAPILGEIAELGCTATNPVAISNNPQELKKELGDRICFIGGLDTQFMDKPATTEEELRASVRRTVDELAPGGSWIANVNLKTKARNGVLWDELIRYSADKFDSARPDA